MDTNCILIVQKPMGYCASKLRENCCYTYDYCFIEPIGHINPIGRSVKRARGKCLTSFWSGFPIGFIMPVNSWERRPISLKNAYLWFMYPRNKNLWSRISHNILIISCCFPCNSMNYEICFKSTRSNQNWKTCILCFAVEVKVVILGFCVVAYLSCWLVICITKRICFLFERLLLIMLFRWLMPDA